MDFWFYFLTINIKFTTFALALFKAFFSIFRLKSPYKFLLFLAGKKLKNVNLRTKQKTC